MHDLDPELWPDRENPKGGGWVSLVFVLVLMVGGYVGWFANKAFSNCAATVLQAQSVDLN